ncbi:hypothetical protein [Streptomyces gossypii]|nr:hypothetical protein [Streptomyces gossypii]
MAFALAAWESEAWLLLFPDAFPRRLASPVGTNRSYGDFLADLDA